jgi:hypothetical protein
MSLPSIVLKVGPPKHQSQNEPQGSFCVFIRFDSKLTAKDAKNAKECRVVHEL